MSITLMAGIPSSATKATAVVWHQYRGILLAQACIHARTVHNGTNSHCQDRPLSS